MFKGKEDYKLKIEEIRLSPELLTIHSRYTGGAGLEKFILILIVSLLLVFYKDIIYIIKDKEQDEQLVLVSIVVLFLTAFFFTLYKMNRNSRKFLIVTEKGLFIEPDFAESWKDIDEYRWIASSEAKKDIFTGQKAETSLMLSDNKGTWPKTFDLMSYGIYFTPDQIQQVDNICQRWGIKKQNVKSY